MKRTGVMLVLAVAVGILGGVVGTQVLSAQQAAVKRTPLLKGELMGIAGKEVTMFMAEIPPALARVNTITPGTSSSMCWKALASSRRKANPRLR